MNYSHKIVCQVPTSYQYSSLCRMGLNNRKVGNGSHIGEMFFYSEDEAKEHLVNRAENYYDDNEEQLNEALSDIENYGMLHIDAATARVIEIENDEEE